MLRRTIGGGVDAMLAVPTCGQLRSARLDTDQSQNGASGAGMTGQARGRFITLEGGEGVGKSVQAERLEKRLAALGLDIVRTREPGGSPGAEALREAILSGFAADFNPAGQALLFAAARVDHLDKTIVPALARGAWVVSDRFADSTRAYQGAAGNLPLAFIATLERLTVGPNQPDLTLILDLPPEIGLKRAAERRRGPADRFESEGLTFHQTLRRAFLDIAAAEPWRCVVIDADRSEDDVAAAIWSAVESRLDPAGALEAKLA
jgi:dTMP kinase